jgi:hypothetical protein
MSSPARATQLMPTEAAAAGDVAALTSALRRSDVAALTDGRASGAFTRYWRWNWPSASPA